MSKRKDKDREMIMKQKKQFYPQNMQEDIMMDMERKKSYYF